MTWPPVTAVRVVVCSHIIHAQSLALPDRDIAFARKFYGIVIPGIVWYSYT